MTLVGIIALVIALVISIALHELGHMVPAKKFGVKVTQYMIGFGPTLWSKKKGDTEYGVKGFLLGGYIRMIGMFPPGPDGQIKANSTGRLGTLIEQARAESAAEIVEPGDEKRTFYALPVRQKLVVMLGGPFMNLVLAVVLFTIVFAGFGTPTPTTTVNTVTACVPSAQDPEGTCAGGTGQPTGAAAAGLQPGDQIVAWDAAPVSQWPELSQAWSPAMCANSATWRARAGASWAWRLSLRPWQASRSFIHPSACGRVLLNGGLTTGRPSASSALWRWRLVWK